ncbi:VOC family protein [Streptomyces sp. AC536]|uniref:VOC family protein n=1 Tax=Streptomyces buecherae TaxID=2763006 RepID=UPI00164CFE80|nr:VOC family protein [Streptomyces buecherae]MBC3986544.1 VOC family protein [Streptomyces buecherae]QNJ43823.1 VOC family protein [Streptomyces buecherae]
MTLALVLDCSDPDALAPFWARALGYRVVRGNPPYVVLGDPGGVGPELLLQRVSEPKRGKNRMHMDLRVPRMEPELARLRALGARTVRGPFDDNGWLTTVLQDPQGNEFCVLEVPDAARPADQRPEAAESTAPDGPSS